MHTIVCACGSALIHFHVLLAFLCPLISHRHIKMCRLSSAKNKVNERACLTSNSNYIRMRVYYTYMRVLIQYNLFYTLHSFHRCRATFPVFV